MLQKNQGTRKFPNFDFSKIVTNFNIFVIKLLNLFDLEKISNQSNILIQ